MTVAEGVIEGEGGWLRVAVFDGVIDAVPVPVEEGVGLMEGESEGVPVPVGVFVLVGVRVPVAVPEGVGVATSEGV